MEQRKKKRFGKLLVNGSGSVVKFDSLKLNCLGFAFLPEELAEGEGTEIEEYGMYSFGEIVL